MTTKIAFVDVNSNEYYVAEKDVFKQVFDADIAKAKLYMPRTELVHSFDYVAHWSKRTLKIVDVKVLHHLVNDSDYFIKHQKQQKLFDKLDTLAADDIDSMPERQYRTWKKMKHYYTRTVTNGN